MSIQNAMMKKSKPLGAVNTVNPAAPGPNGGFGPISVPPAATSNLAQGLAGLQTDQNNANAANQQRYTQGLSTLTGGYNAALGNVNTAIQDSANFGQAAQQKLDYQLQHNLSQQQQSAVSRGLGDTTIADTMKDLPQRQYNDASAQVTEMQANRKAGLDLNAANTQTQGANSIASFIASRNDVPPNAQMYAGLAQKAASNPGQRSVSMGGNPGNTQSDFMSGQGGGGGAAGGGGGSRNGGGGLPNTSNGGGAGSLTGGSGPLSFGASFGNPPAPSSTQGYTGGAAAGGGAMGNPADQTGGSAFFGNGSSVTPGGAATVGKPTNTVTELPQQSAAAPAAPSSIASAMQPQQTLNPWTGKWTSGGAGGINWG